MHRQHLREVAFVMHLMPGLCTMPASSNWLFKMQGCAPVEVCAEMSAVRAPALKLWQEYVQHIQSGQAYHDGSQPQ